MRRAEDTLVQRQRDLVQHSYFGESLWIEPLGLLGFEEDLDVQETARVGVCRCRAGQGQSLCRVFLRVATWPYLGLGEGRHCWLGIRTGVNEKRTLGRTVLYWTKSKAVLITWYVRISEILKCKRITAFSKKCRAMCSGTGRLSHPCRRLRQEGHKFECYPGEKIP